MSGESSKGLLQRARGGDRDALDELLGRIRERLRTLVDSDVGRRLRAKVRSSDIVQSTYLEVLKKVSEFEGDDEEAFAAWVVRILRNNVQRKVRYFGAEKRRESDGLDEAVEKAPGRAPLPSHEVSRAEDLTLISRALGELPENLREVIVWRAVEGRSFEEIADLGGTTVPGARTLLWRARAALTVKVKRLDELGR